MVALLIECGCTANPVNWYGCTTELVNWTNRKFPQSSSLGVTADEQGNAWGVLFVKGHRQLTKGIYAVQLPAATSGDAPLYSTPPLPKSELIPINDAPQAVRHGWRFRTLRIGKVKQPKLPPYVAYAVSLKESKVPPSAIYGVSLTLGRAVWYWADRDTGQWRLLTSVEIDWGHKSFWRRCLGYPLLPAAVCVDIVLAPFSLLLCSD
jgi:hypothetical protein